MYTCTLYVHVGVSDTKAEKCAKAEFFVSGSSVLHMEGRFRRRVGRPVSHIVVGIGTWCIVGMGMASR